MKLISVTQWAKKNNVSRQRVHQWIKEGRINFHKKEQLVYAIDEDEPRPGPGIRGPKTNKTQGVSE